MRRWIGLLATVLIVGCSTAPPPVGRNATSAAPTLRR